MHLPHLLSPHKIFLHILYPDILQIWKLDDATLAPFSILRNKQIRAAINEKPISSDISMTNHATVLKSHLYPCFHGHRIL